MNYIFLIRAKRRGSDRFQILNLGTIREKGEAIQRGKSLSAEWDEAWIMQQTAIGDGRIVHEERVR